jgi:hypothetical protein
MGVPVVDTRPSSAPPRPAAGQRWRKPDGTTFTVIETDGSTIVGAREQHGTTALEVVQEEQLHQFKLETAPDVWWVKFDVDQIPLTLAALLLEHDIVATRLARPGDPKPGSNVLAVGTIEAHVAAPSESVARARVIAALKGRQDLAPDDIVVRRLGG